METALEIVVRPTEVNVNGHVNNAKYVEYMEWGRKDMIRAPRASLRPAFGARGRDGDGESEVKGGRKSVLDDPSPTRTASRQTSGRTGSAGHWPSALSSFGNQAVVSFPPGLTRPSVHRALGPGRSSW
ncbi:MAG: acyl-CoA thioesterase [Isosphaeraceae bacterium]